MEHTKQGALLVAECVTGYRDHIMKDWQRRDTASKNVNIWTGKGDRRIYFRKQARALVKQIQVVQIREREVPR